jgi:hypothetical protein
VLKEKITKKAGIQKVNKPGEQPQSVNISANKATG